MVIVMRTGFGYTKGLKLEFFYDAIDGCLGVYFLLIKEILESMLVCWMSISRILKGKLNKIEVLQFLWIGKMSKEGITLVKWTKLETLEETGGGD